MNNIKSFFKAAVIATILQLLFVGYASAALVTLTFNGGTISDVTYTENGVNFSKDSSVDLNPYHSGNFSDRNGDGSNEFVSLGSAGCCHIDISMVSGMIFDLLSVEVYPGVTQMDPASHFGGTNFVSSSGSVLSLSGLPGGIYDLTGDAGWENLSSVRFNDISGARIETMKFSATSVNEPSVIALLGIGLLGIRIAQRMRY